MSSFLLGRLPLPEPCGPPSGELEATDPDYVSVTYGASGSNRDTAVELVNRLVLETTLRPLAHLTCVGNTPTELAEIIGELLDAGVRGILALRGDLPKDGGEPVSGSLRYAQDLIELIRRVEQRRSALLCAGKVAVGVAAYPTRHPESPSEAHDVEVLLAKQRSGADFAITQVFFRTEQTRTSSRGPAGPASRSPSSRASCRSRACAGSGALAS